MQVPVRWADAGGGGGPLPARALDACPGQARRCRSWYLVSVGVVDYSGLGLLSENRERERDSSRGSVHSHRCEGQSSASR